MLVGANTFSGGITIEEGSVALNHSSGAGTGPITVLGGGISYVDGVNIANTIDLQNDVNFSILSGSATQSGVIGETGGSFQITKNGLGTVALTAANTFTGGVAVITGTVRLGHNSGAGSGQISLLGLGSTSTLDYASGVNIPNTIDLQDNANLNVSSGSATQSGAIGQTGGAFGITKTGDGILLLNATNTSTGPMRVDGGILGITGGGTRSSTTNISAAGTLVVTGGTFIAAETITNNRNLSIAIDGRLTGNGANGANGAGIDGAPGGAGSPGRMITSIGTLLMSGSSQTTLNGGAGGSGASGVLGGGRGGHGGRGGTINLTGGSATIDDSVTLNLNGGAGGEGGSGGFGDRGDNGNGGSGGVLSLAGGTVGSISGSATVRLNGATGQVGGLGGDINVSVSISDSAAVSLNGGTGVLLGDGGRGGTINVSDGMLSIFDSAAVSLNGASGNTGGDGGRGGDIKLSDGTLSISDSAVVTLNGGNGGAAIGTISGGDSGQGGTLDVSGGALSFFEDAVINITGGVGANADITFFPFGGTTITPASDGGDGGAFNVSGGTVSISDSAVVNIRGVRGGSGLNFTRGAHGGTGGTVQLSGGVLNMTGGQLNVSGGTGGIGDTTNGSPGAAGSVQVNGGTFNLAAGLISGVGSPTASADPITLISANVAVTSGGVLNFQDDVTVNGGLLTRDGTSDLNLAAGKKLTAVNNAQIRFTEPYLIKNGTTLEITDGSTLSSDVFIAVGLESSGTLIVDNATVETGSAVLTNAPWADGVANADVTIRNNATANFGSHISLVGSGPPGRSGIIRVQSGADMTVHNLTVANNSSGDGTVLVDGDGTTLVQDAAASLTVGTTSSNTATIDVTNQGEFTTGTGPISIRPTGTLNVSGGRFNAHGDMAVNGTVNLQDGTMDAGRITLNSGAGGAFNFTGGTLHVETFDGDLNNQGGTLAPGNSPGITQVTNVYTQATAGKLAIEVAGVGGAGAADGHDQLAVTGGTTLDGTLDVALIDGFVPRWGDTFDVVTAPTINGNFSELTGNVFRLEEIGQDDIALVPEVLVDVDGGDADVVRLTTTGMGDANVDGRVTFADFSALQLSFGEEGDDIDWFDGDFTGDGRVTFADFSLLQLNFGEVFFTPPSPGRVDLVDDLIVDVSQLTIPEPGVSCLLAFGGIMMIRRRSVWVGRRLSGALASIYASRCRRQEHRSR